MSGVSGWLWYGVNVDVDVDVCSDVYGVVVLWNCDVMDCCVGFGWWRVCKLVEWRELMMGF